MATYRVRVESSEAAANGDVHLSCQIQKLVSEDPDVWELVPNGRRTMVLKGATVLAITEHPTWSDGEKLTALGDEFRRNAAGWGIDEADDANTQMLALLPGGFPQDVAL